MRRIRSILVLGSLALTACLDSGLEPQPAAIPAVTFAKRPSGKNPMVEVGALIYNDARLSRLENQSCASCHVPDWGFAGPDDGSIVSIANTFFEGSISGRFGDRKAPSAAYAAYAEPLKYDPREGTYRGGNFWDGRATGGRGMAAAAVQALGPFEADPEHAFSAICVLYEISVGPYAAAFQSATGVKLNTIPFAKVASNMRTWCHNPSPSFNPADPVHLARLSTSERVHLDAAYNAVGNAIAAFEFSPMVNRFNSRFDTGNLTRDERDGEDLFFGRSGCHKCHVSDVAPEIFTDFSYYNIGVPRNPANPMGPDWKDPGLGGFLAQGFDVRRAAAFMGFFKSSSLRNVDKRIGAGARTYMHNGALTSLEQVVHFYNTRDVKSCARLNIPESQAVLPTGPGDNRPNACWPAPDFPATVVRTMGGVDNPMGNLRLSARDERLIVAYMKALSDGAQP
jgi:cytochrome c peroxidase